MIQASPPLSVLELEQIVQRSLKLPPEKHIIEQNIAEHNGKLQKNSSYMLKIFQVRDYVAIKSLSMGREGSEIF